MKKVTIHIDSCDNCPFNTHESKPMCTYLTYLVNAPGQPIKGRKRTQRYCLLDEQTEEDSIPGRFVFKQSKTGLNIDIDN